MRGIILKWKNIIVIISSEKRKERKYRVKMVKIEIENNEKMMMVTRNGKFILKKYLNIFCNVEAMCVLYTLNVCQNEESLAIS